MLGYHEFRASTKGRIIADLIGRSDSIAEMERQSHLRKPAVGAIDQAIVDDVGRLDDIERQHVGRAVRDILGARGWRPAHRKRLKSGHTFASGAVYELSRKGSPGTASTISAADRFAEARRLLLASRRDPTAPMDTVDAFLADRRAMWGSI